MKVTINRAKEQTVKLNDMPEGSFGVDKDGRVWLRTIYCAVCISAYGNSYTSNFNNRPVPEDSSIRVAILRSNDKFTVVV